MDFFLAIIKETKTIKTSPKGMPKERPMIKALLLPEQTPIVEEMELLEKEFLEFKQGF